MTLKVLPNIFLYDKDDRLLLFFLYENNMNHLPQSPMIYGPGPPLISQKWRLEGVCGPFYTTPKKQ